MPLERRNEPFMLRQFHKMYPSYNINPLLRRRPSSWSKRKPFCFCFAHAPLRVGRLALRVSRE